MKNQRIAYLVSRFPAVSHTFILREVRGLRALGFDIRPFSINAPDRALSAMSAEEFDETRRTFYVKAAGLESALAAHAWALTHQPGSWFKGLAATWNLRSAFGIGKGLAYFTEALMIGRELSRHGVRALHVHFASAAASVGLIARHAFDLQLSMTVHGPDEFDAVERHALSQKVAGAHAIVCISQFVRGQLMRLSDPSHWHKMSIVRLGVDPLRHVPPASRPDKESPEILCVGRLAPAKGQRLLLEAVARLRDQGIRVRLTLVGAGPDADGLKARCQELGLQTRVTFTGALDEAQVLKRMQDADIFALPSFAEGIPVVLMEAMACGLPCVTTPVNGIPELVTHGVNGLLCAPSDIDALVSAFQMLLHSTALRQQLGQAGRHRVESQYHLVRNVETLAATLQAQAQPAVGQITSPRLATSIQGN